MFSRLYVRLWLCAFAVSVVYSSSIHRRAVSEVRICAWNVQTFGNAKMSDPVLANMINQVVRIYDVVVIQEIRDISNWSQGELLLLLNHLNPDNWTYVMSERLGRTSYKEQYGFYYKTSVLTQVGTHQFEDGIDDGHDDFEREPFSVKFAINDHVTSVSEFILTALHAKPDNAVAEIDFLMDVYQDLQNHWGDENVIILGDLNAACSYANQAELDNTRIGQDSSFKWYIQMSDDTTTSTTTDCAYDRFVIKGSNIQNAVVGGVAHIYHYDTDWNLDNDLARDVSDHYPIEITIR